MLVYANVELIKNHFIAWTLQRMTGQRILEFSLNETEIR